ncbi:MAG TPA: sigma-70 family RNA polymerase sigma factor [Gemmatimonadaceae bacterium]|nr:sigma-70 family RNA polymerase sigma factor [Gemmatimonadaceae bacterium]
MNHPMHDHDWLAERFEANRAHLRGVAFRMLGSLPEADDAVQETWLRLSRSEAADIENLGGWLTTVVGRVCLDMLRSRDARREDSIEAADPVAMANAPHDPEQDALLADSVGLALLVVLDVLEPAERLAFVLHDMFAVPFDEIARIVGRSPAAVRQLASRARRRVRGAPAYSSAEIDRQRAVVEAFLGALRNGDYDGLIAVLDPDVVVRADTGPEHAMMESRGAENWAKGAVRFGRALRFAEPALVDGAVGLVLAPKGKLLRALKFKIVNDRVAEVAVITSGERLRGLSIGALLP